MYWYFRLVAFFYVVYCVVALAPQAGSAPDLAARAAAPATSVQRSGPSGFPELERRAAAQEGLSDHDRTFLMTAVQAEMLQLELSRVAIAHARNPAVRHFAEATAQFMGKTASRLDGVANEFGVSLRRIVPDEVEKAQIALGKSKDPDREYLTRILADTARASSRYRDESSRGEESGGCAVRPGDVPAAGAASSQRVAVPGDDQSPGCRSQAFAHGASPQILIQLCRPSR